MLIDARHEYPDQACVAPGERARAYLRFARPEYQAGRLSEDLVFTIQEGARVIGSGRITRVLNPVLLAWDTSSDGWSV